MLGSATVSSTGKLFFTYSRNDLSIFVGEGGSNIFLSDVTSAVTQYSYIHFLLALSVFE